MIKKQLGLTAIKFCGDPNLEIVRAAVCSGSGGSMLKTFFASDAQVYISGDMQYHDAKDVESAGRGMVDMGHFASEHLMVEVSVRKLESILNKRSWDIKVEMCLTEKDPFEVI
jgi:putative NIF3 family GTP cyclohydrolase 1 type 2